MQLKLESINVEIVQILNITMWSGIEISGMTRLKIKLSRTTLNNSKTITKMDKNWLLYIALTIVFKPMHEKNGQRTTTTLLYKTCFEELQQHLKSSGM